MEQFARMIREFPNDAFNALIDLGQGQIANMDMRVGHDEPNPADLLMPGDLNVPRQAEQGGDEQHSVEEEEDGESPEEEEVRICFVFSHLKIPKVWVIVFPCTDYSEFGGEILGTSGGSE